MGREIQIPTRPIRIISIVPSQTELLFDLGLGDTVIGITKFCVHPSNWFSSKMKVGGTKQLDFKKIEALNPDLIIGNKEENNKSQVKELMGRYPVWMSDITNLDDAYAMISSIGNITNTVNRSNQIITSIKNNFSKVVPNNKSLKTIYLIWQNPYMAAGGKTFIDHILSVCGLANVVSTLRYPEITSHEVTRLNPDLLLLSSEPYPFKEEHSSALQLIAPDAQIKLVDGELFSWYGSRLLHTPQYFQHLLSEI